jgi:hypothetical protein
MVPATLSAGTIVHSALLKNSQSQGAITYPLGVLMNKISTQQSTWMEMMESGLMMASTKERGNAIFFCWGNGYVMAVPGLL